MLNLNEIYLAEYSVTQGCFHVETAREAMESNLRQIVGGWTNSYLVFAVCGSHEEAGEACDVLAEAMKKHGAKAGSFGVNAPDESDVQIVQVTP